MDLSNIKSGGQLTERILAQAACTREDTYALLDLVQTFNDPCRIEARLVRLFILMASQEWTEGRITIEITFKDATVRGCPTKECVVRLLTPTSSSSQAMLKSVSVRASYKTFQDAFRDRRKLSPYMLEDKHIGKFILIAGHSLSLVPPSGAEQARQKLAARLERIGFKSGTMPPEMRQRLEEMKKGAPPRAGQAKPLPKNVPRPTTVQIPRPARLPADFVDLEQGWGDEENPTLPKPRK
ncbi:MAG: hypothetical protein WCW31_05190 [Patescibacteria group bacterium]|jgi:hypothetical protein